MRMIPITNELLNGIHNAPKLVELGEDPVMLVHGKAIQSITTSGDTIVDVLNHLPFRADRATRILTMRMEPYTTEWGIGDKYFLRYYEL